MNACANKSIMTKCVVRFKFVDLVAIVAFAGVMSTLSAASLNHVEDLTITFQWSGLRVPKWTHGALITVQYHDTTNALIWAFERGGKRAVPFTIPAARSMLIYDWDRGVDGLFAVTGSATDADGRVTGFVASISADGAKSQVIRTELYGPAMVTVATDRTLS